jgi:hypothetical protein
MNFKDTVQALMPLPLAVAAAMQLPMLLLRTVCDDSASMCWHLKLRKEGQTVHIHALLISCLVIPRQ